MEKVIYEMVTGCPDLSFICMLIVAIQMVLAALYLLYCWAVSPMYSEDTWK